MSGSVPFQEFESLTFHHLNLIWKDVRVRFNVAALKTAVGKTTGGSNPSPSAINGELAEWLNAVVSKTTEL